MVFRSLTLGLLGACLYFVVAHDGVAPLIGAREPTQRIVMRPAPVQVIDIARGLPALEVPTLLQLAPDEHIAEVDNRVVADEDAAWRAIVLGAGGESAHGAATRAGQFVDLIVESSSGQRRRVLLLLH